MAKAKAAVVTGSTSGIGLAIARALARGGANVMINGFGDAGEIEQTRAEVERQCGVRALYSAADMSKPVEIAEMIRAAVPGMKARKWGRIINTASAHSLVASPFKSAYVTAKHGLAGLTKTVALEVATFGITVNCFSPGYVWTPLVERQIPDTMKARNLTKEQVISDVLLAAQPTKQFVTVDQVAALVVFLCSDAAAQITGANLSIDGGWTAQ